MIYSIKIILIQAYHFINKINKRSKIIPMFRVYTIVVYTIYIIVYTIEYIHIYNVSTYVYTYIYIQRITLLTQPRKTSYASTSQCV